MNETSDLDRQLVAGFWRAVAAHGWDGLTMRAVAIAAGVPMEQVRRRAPSPLHLLALHGLLADQAVLAGAVADQGGTARDRLFDALMRRIDVLQPHRAGVLRLLHDLRRDPLTAALLLSGLPRSMRWMLEAAAVDTTGLAGLLRGTGVLGVWLTTVRAWTKDGSEELGATMAALDRALDRAEQVGRTIRLQPGG